MYAAILDRLAYVNKNIYLCPEFKIWDKMNINEEDKYYASMVCKFHRVRIYYF